MMSRFTLVALLVSVAVAPSLATAEPATIKRFEAPVYSAPDVSAPVMAVLTENTAVSVSEEATNGFRRVRLEDGAIGWVLESALTFPSTMQPAPPAPPQAYPAPPPPPPPPPAPAIGTAHRHLGFFLRLDLGVGYLRSQAGTSRGDAVIDGFSGAFSVALGGAVAENVIVGGHLWDIVATSPNVKVGSLSGSTSTGDTYGLIGLGPTLNVYFMPANAYLAFTPSVTWLNSRVNGSTSASSDAGFGFRLAGGKEWWVSDHWGVGFEAQTSFSVNKDSGSGSPTWTTWGVSGAFSATYN